MRLDLAEICDCLGLPVRHAEQRPTALRIDSRLVAPGEIFMALPGARTDGHLFIEQALAAGAVAVIAERRRLPARLAGEGRILPVDDCFRALRALATRTREAYRGKVLAVTGSNGKTTTKDLALHLLREVRSCSGSPGNYNSTLGAPLAMINALKDAGVYIMEAGASGFGEIAAICELCRPAAGCITNIDLAHLEHFGDLEGVARAKAELWDWLARSNGLALVNMDDSRVADRARRVPRRRDFSLARGETGAAFAMEFLGMDPEARARIALGNRELSLPVRGRAFLECAACAVAICAWLGAGQEALARGLESYGGMASRMSLCEIRGARVLDDSYNANPPSLKAAAGTLADMDCAGRRVAVLGGMNELGDGSAELHRSTGRELADLGLDEFVLVGGGPDLDALEAGLREGGQSCVTRVETPASAASAVEDLGTGDLLLLKGSRTYELEKVLEALS